MSPTAPVTPFDATSTSGSLRSVAIVTSRQVRAYLLCILATQLLKGGKQLKSAGSRFCLCLGFGFGCCYGFAHHAFQLLGISVSLRFQLDPQQHLQQLIMTGDFHFHFSPFQLLFKTSNPSILAFTSFDVKNQPGNALDITHIL